ncbi:MAG: hypothetical protein AAF216_04145 [Pseudomonadota bacterium]
MALDGSSVHYGGVLGVAGLAVTLAGCAYIATTASAQSVSLMPIRSMEQITVPATGPLVEAIDEAPSPPQVKPASLETPVQTVEPAPEPATAETMTDVRATFIVKFKPDPAIDDVIANWRSNREAALARFAGWAADDPLFSEMTLEGCSYSGELLLARSLSVQSTGARGAVSTLTGDIRSHSAVAYADPDFTAHPGKSARDE